MDIWCGHFAAQGESLPFLSPHKLPTDVRDTLSSPRRKQLYYILLSILLNEQLVLNHICSHCVEAHISNFALSCQ